MKLRGFSLLVDLVLVTGIATILIGSVLLFVPGVAGGLKAAWMILNGQLSYRMSGDSMDPNFHNFEIWNVREYKKTAPQRGDVVMFDAKDDYEKNPKSQRV